jgi:hypothetical protein
VRWNRNFKNLNFAELKTGVRSRKDGGKEQKILYSPWRGGPPYVSNAVASAIGSSGRRRGHHWGSRTGGGA